MARQRLGSISDGYIDKLQDDLIAAGIEPQEMKAVEMFGLQVLGACILPVFWGVLLKQIGMFDFMFEGPKMVLFFAFLLVAGFYFPRMNLRERAKKRQKAIALTLPDMLDLLTISVQAGMGLLPAMEKIVKEQRPGPLKDELQRFFDQTKLNVPAPDALKIMAKRVQLADLNAVVAALNQGLKLGVPIAPILSAQSDMLRTRRTQRAEKAVQEAPVKMLAPLMICILPSVFIMILAPIIIKMIQDVHK